jgi:hypothetical protein
LERPIETDELIRYYPQLYHMAEPGSWPSIREHGLLSASALLDLFEVQGPERYAIESMRRPAPVTIQHPRLGTAVIRDQIPLTESKLVKVLDGMTPREWYELLNRHVYFWPTRQRLERLLGARAYRARPHTILEIDTRTLVEEHADRIRLAPINTGSTLFNPPRRGPQTFLTIADFPFEERRKKYGLQAAIGEVSVEFAVTDILDLVERAIDWSDGVPLRGLRERPS